MNINKKFVKNFVDSIIIEDNLPSNAGMAFRNLININCEYNLGYRELEIIKNWIEEYQNTSAENKDEIINQLS